MIIRPNLSCSHWWEFVYTRTSWGHFAPASNWVNDATSFFYLGFMLPLFLTPPPNFWVDPCKVVYVFLKMDYHSIFAFENEFGNTLFNYIKREHENMHHLSYDGVRAKLFIGWWEGDIIDVSLRGGRHHFWCLTELKSYDKNVIALTGWVTLKLSSLVVCVAMMSPEGKAWGGHPHTPLGKTTLMSPSSSSNNW